MRLWNENGQQAYNLTTLAGQNVTFNLETDPDPTKAGKVVVNGGHLWYPDIKGVDGYVVLVVVVGSVVVVVVAMDLLVACRLVRCIGISLLQILSLRVSSFLVYIQLDALYHHSPSPPIIHPHCL